MTNIFNCPVQVVYGKGCVNGHSSLIAAHGTKALVVTTPSSAKNGSREDVISALKREGMGYAVFDRCENNPSLKMADELGDFARNSGCDLVIGLGGGSPMDSAKAAAVLAANDFPASELFKNRYPNPPLPLILIPTTAGTGSEMSYTGVLTVDGGTNKKLRHYRPSRQSGLSGRFVYRKAAHAPCQEHRCGRFRPRAGRVYKAGRHPHGRGFRAEVFRGFAECRGALLRDSLDFETREKLLMNAMYAGIVIAQERTLGLHVASYPLTALYGVQHGLAVGLPMAAYVKLNYAEAKEKIDEVLGILGLFSPEAFKGYIGDLLEDRNTYTLTDVERMTKVCLEGVMARDNPHKFTEEDVLNLYLESLNMV